MSKPPGVPIMLNRGDYLAWVEPVAMTPAGRWVVEWSVRDLTDPPPAQPFARGRAVGVDLATTECAQAARDRMAATQ